LPQHVPWYAPARFWDLYPLDKVPPAPHPGLVTGNVDVAMQDWQALGFCNSPDMNASCEPLSKAYPLDNTTFPLAAAQYARQAYFATVSWTDANIGKVLDAFEKTKFAEGNDYVLAVWGDHVSCCFAPSAFQLWFHPGRMLRVACCLPVLLPTLCSAESATGMAPGGQRHLGEDE
jgi:arylsulfatase A-like enzyme